MSREALLVLLACQVLTASFKAARLRVAYRNSICFFAETSSDNASPSDLRAKRSIPHATSQGNTCSYRSTVITPPKLIRPFVFLSTLSLNSDTRPGYFIWRRRLSTEAGQSAVPAESPHSLPLVWPHCCSPMNIVKKDFAKGLDYAYPGVVVFFLSSLYP